MTDYPVLESNLKSLSSRMPISHPQARLQTNASLSSSCRKCPTIRRRARRVAGRISDAATAEDSGALVDAFPASIGQSEPIEGESLGECGWASRSGSLHVGAVGPRAVTGCRMHTGRRSRPSPGCRRLVVQQTQVCNITHGEISELLETLNVFGWVRSTPRPGA